MQNTTIGTNFEKDLAQILSKNGFWVRMDSRGRNGQTVDLIACKNNVPYLIECKYCKSEYFDMRRVENNQNMALKRFKLCGNTNTFFVFSTPSGVYFSPNPIPRPNKGIPLDVWLKHHKH